MTYSVKTLYPQFKCLTAHRAVMKRIPNYKKTGAKKDPRRTKVWWCCLYVNAIIMDVEWEAEHYNKLSRMYRWKLQEGHYAPLREDWDDEDLITEYPDCYRVNKNEEIVFAYERVRNRWLWEEQNKIDMIAKKWEFYQAMLKRDEVLGMRNSLPDEIVGEIFGFL